VKILDLAALKEAIKQFPELTWCEGQKTWKFWGSWANDYHEADAAYKRLGIDPKSYGKGEHAIKVKGCNWEIGVVARKDGGYALVYDFYGQQGRRIQEVVGEQANKLCQQYSKAVVVKQAKRAGYSVRERQLPNGSIKMQLLRV